MSNQFTVLWAPFAPLLVAGQTFVASPPKSGTARKASLKRFVKLAAQITSVSSTI